MLRSVIITAHNEGAELRRTVDSLLSAARDDIEVVIVDDGSADGSAERLERDRVRVVRHTNRTGVAFSRDHGARLAGGQVLAFVDGHQRFSPGWLEACAHTALRHRAIVWPDVGGFERRDLIGHGAAFHFSPKRNCFSARWKRLPPTRRVTRISSLKAPGYVMPRSVYERARWIGELRGWGGTEAAISLKAFFLGVPLFHLCGPLARHRFNRSFSYDVTSQEVWRNQALIARVCFEERTWFEYWLPHVFAERLQPAVSAELDSDSVRDQQREFERQKIRTDREFWTSLLKSSEPAVLRQTTNAKRCRA